MQIIEHMAPQSPNHHNPQQRSTESYGVGQSGCLAGRHHGEPTLERNIEARNVAYPRGLDEHLLESGDDERWIGRGGLPWAPTTPTLEQHSDDQRTSDEQQPAEEK